MKRRFLVTMSSATLAFLCEFTVWARNELDAIARARSIQTNIPDDAHWEARELEDGE